MASDSKTTSIRNSATPLGNTSSFYFNFNTQPIRFSGHRRAFSENADRSAYLPRVSF